VVQTIQFTLYTQIVIIMKKILFEKTGKPADILQVVETEITEPKANEVRIRVKASPINPSDVMFVQGLYGLKPVLPSGAGFEGSGIIDKVGEGINLAVGTKVSFMGTGAWAEYVCVPQQAVISLPDEISFETASQTFVNPFTAWAMLHESGLQAGDWLLLTAGGSAFAQLVIQLAVAKGIKVICTVRRNVQKEQLLALGATAVINTTEDFLPKKVKQLTEGKFATACFDATGGELGKLALQSLTDNATMWVYGLLSLEETPVHNGLMLFKNLTIKGFWLSTWIVKVAKDVRKQAAIDVIGLLASKKLEIKVDATYALQDCIKAVAHSESEGRTGKILLVM
jgi:NADPH:quinone reductase-like Zn-dependent oxidoreductase